MGTDRPPPARGEPGRPRVDDRRATGGIPHVLKTGCRRSDVPPEHGPAGTVCDGCNRWARPGVGRRLFERAATAGAVPGEPLVDGSRAKAHRSAAAAKGECAQAVGRPRGGRTSRIRRLAHGRGRPVVLTLTPGNVADASMAMPLLEAVAPPGRLIADEAYDAGSLRWWPEARRAHRGRHPAHRQPNGVSYPLDRRAYA